jgi:S-adenosylmethionine-diacylgycerolhomoserine-N-methlytransferase
MPGCNPIIRSSPRIYNATRWSFLFGRRRVIRLLPFATSKAFYGLEVGCGTGYNLRYLAKKFPRAKFCGMDVSEDMIQLAQRATKPFADRVTLIQEPYTSAPNPLTGKLDLVLFSYSLTMINPQWQDLIGRAWEDLREGGVLAVVDFHSSRFSGFRNHMAKHHVRMEGHLLPFLQNLDCQKTVARTHAAYGGVWEYMLFVGRKG